MKYLHIKIVLLATIFIFSLLTYSFVSAPKKQKSPKSIKKYNVERGIVEYELSGVTKGKQTVYFENWGLHEAIYSSNETTMMGVTSKTNNLTIIDGEWVYNIDIDTKKGTKSKNMAYENLVKYYKDKKIKDKNAQMMKDMGAEKIGTEKILDRTCDVWEIKKMGTKTWLWKGITMKNMTKGGGMAINMTAIKLEDNMKIDAVKFKIPEDVKIVESRIVQDN